MDLVWDSTVFLFSSCIKLYCSFQKYPTYFQANKFCIFCFFLWILFCEKQQNIISDENFISSMMDQLSLL